MKSLTSKLTSLSIVIASIICLQKIKAQSFLENSINSQNYTLSNPDVNNLERYNLTDIANYSGKANIEIPIYTIKTGNIVYPINLVYNSGGIKVDQLSSEVGLGWNITSSIITRTINQFNDFDNLGNISLQSDHTDYTANDIIASDTLDYKRVGYFLHKEIGGASLGPSNTCDFLPDLYHFYSGTSSMSFFFNDVNTPIELNPKGFKIEAVIDKKRIDTNKGNYNTANTWEPIFNILTKDFFSIKITTPEGIEYTFSDCDYSYNQILNGKSELDSPVQVSAWHITTIKDKRTGKKIDFIYENTSSNPNHPSDSENYLNSMQAQRTFANSHCTSEPNEPITLFYINSITTPTARIDVQRKRLKKIVFDKGEIEFNYNNDGVLNQAPIIREDVYNADCLTQISLKSGFSQVKKYQFNYDYFNSDYNVGEFNPDQAYNSFRYKRLKLVSFNEVNKPSYNFVYDESEKLPPINSFSVDFLGFYNNSPDIDSPFNFLFINPIPTLYHYPNQFEKSLLPYPVTNMNPDVIQGYFNRQANEHSKAWSLVKVIYPMGGSSEYLYESNQFQEFGQNIKGGGIRVAEQIINDGSGKIKTIHYSYLLDNGLSSGTLFSQPFFGYPVTGNFNYSINYTNPPTITSYGSNSNITWLIYDKSHLNEDITSGAFVGYSKVIETETGKGRIEYDYTSNNLSGYQNEINRIQPQTLTSPDLFHPDLLYTGRIDDLTGIPEYNSDGTYNYAIGNSGLFTNIFTDNSYKRGHLTQKKIYSEQNELIEKTEIEYSENLINTFTYYQGFVKIVQKFPLSHYTSLHHFNGEAPGYHRVRDFRAYLRDNSEAFITVKKDIKIAQFLPHSIKTSKYYGSDSNVSVIYYSYNINGNIKSIETRQSGGDVVLKKIYYPQSPSLITEPFINSIVAENLIALPIKTEIYRNSIKISEQKIEYGIDSSTNNLILPKFVYAKKGDDVNANLERKISYNLYDDKGNLIEYSEDLGMTVSLIWSYNKTELVAKIENIKYADIPSNLVTDIQLAPSNSNLNALRNSTNTNLRGAMITTYTYEPLIGVSSVTDTKGYTTFYEYDDSGRLKFIKDATGNILKENEYNLFQN